MPFKEEAGNIYIGFWRLAQSINRLYPCFSVSEWKFVYTVRYRKKRIDASKCNAAYTVTVLTDVA